jgi:GNAT superfamily N-acetyltransferase
MSLLFVRKEFSGQGIGRELLPLCSYDLHRGTVNAAEAAVGFYHKVGFRQSGDRFVKYGIWGTPMRWLNLSSKEMK